MTQHIEVFCLFNYQRRLLETKSGRSTFSQENHLSYNVSLVHRLGCKDSCVFWLILRRYCRIIVVVTAQPNSCEAQCKFVF